MLSFLFIDLIWIFFILSNIFPEWRKTNELAGKKTAEWRVKVETRKSDLKTNAFEDCVSSIYMRTFKL